MPSRSAITQIRLDNIITCLNATVNTVELVSKGLKTPFLEAIINTVCSLSAAVQVIIQDPDFMVTDRQFLDSEEEQGGLCSNARENSPAPQRNHSSSHNFEHWW
jgi:hypothetical protein